MIIWRVGAAGPDVYLDMEAGNNNDLVFTNLAAQSSHGSGGVWHTENEGVEDATLTSFVVATSGEQAILRPITISGTTYTDVGSTRSWRITNTVDWELLKYVFASTKATVTMGVYFTMSSSGWATSDFFDVVALEAPGGEFAVMSLEDKSSGNPNVAIHTDAGRSAQEINLVRGSTYWITIKWDKANNLTTLVVYDAVTWLQVGSSTLALTQFTPDDCKFVSIGRYDNHNKFANGTIQYDDLVIDSTGTTYPLLPATDTLVCTNAGRTAVTAQITAASAGYNIVIPADSNTWNGKFTFSTSSLTIAGISTNVSGGTWITNISTTAQDSLLEWTGTFLMVSNLNICAPTNYTNHFAWGLRPKGNNFNVYKCHFEWLLAPVVSDSFGAMYNCSVYNCDRMGRSFGPDDGTANWNSYAPVNWCATNWCAFEDNKYVVDAANPTAAIVVISSQQGALWMARNNDILISGSGKQFDPIFDSHGPTDPGLRGNIGVIVVGNKITFTNGATFSKCVDIRGGACLGASNTVVGASDTSAMYMRRKDMEPADYFENGGIEQVTNSWFWANTMLGTNMPPVVEANDASIITLGQSYEDFAPSPINMPKYPFIMRRVDGITGCLQDNAGPAPPTQCPQLTRMIRLRL